LERGHTLKVYCLLYDCSHGLHYALRDFVRPFVCDSVFVRLTGF